MRTALGAGQWRIARQMLTESVLLGLLGAGVGWGLTLWATDIISALRIATDVPLRIDVRPSPTVFYFAVVTALLTGVIAGSRSEPACRESQPPRRAQRGRAWLERRPPASA